MSDDRKQLILIIVPTVALAIVFIITGIAVARRLLTNSRRNTLPVTETTFLQRHLDILRTWKTPTQLASRSVVKIDPHHRPLTLAMPAPTHPPASTTNGSYKKFQEKQKQRQKQRQMRAQQPDIPLEPWVHRPMGPAYWRQVGREMQMRKSRWEKMKNWMGF
jgi:hypothetical protein